MFQFEKSRKRGLTLLGSRCRPTPNIKGRPLFGWLMSGLNGAGSTSLSTSLLFCFARFFALLVNAGAIKYPRVAPKASILVSKSGISSFPMGFFLFLHSKIITWSWPESESIVSIRSISCRTPLIVLYTLFSIFHFDFARTGSLESMCSSICFTAVSSSAPFCTDF